MHQPPENRNVHTLLLGSLGLGAIFTGLFYGKPPGLSMPLFTVCFFALMYAGVERNRIFLGLNGKLLPTAVLLLTATYALFDHPTFLLLNRLAVPCLVVWHTIWLSEKSIRLPGLPQLVYLFERLLPRFFKGLPVPFHYGGAVIRRGLEGKGSGTAGRIALGLALVVPVLAIVLTLLSSADGLFNRMMAGMWSSIGHIPFGEWIGRLVVTLLIAVVAFAYLHTLLPCPKENEKEWTGGPVLPRLPFDPVVAVTFLVVLDLVYLLFVSVQFSYFFGLVQEGALPAGMTYADYARRGFAELVLVSLLNATVLLVTVLAMKRKPDPLLFSLIRLLLSFLNICTGVLLVSAFMRLQLYEEAYGYTYIRLYVHSFMVLLAAFLALLFVKIWRERLPIHGPAVLLALTGYVTMNYLNPDALIAKANLIRYTETGKLDAPYLSSLSTDAVPVIAGWLHEHPGEMPLLTELMIEKREALQAGYEGWPAWNLSHSRALQKLNDLEQIETNRPSHPSNNVQRLEGVQ